MSSLLLGMSTRDSLVLVMTNDQALVAKWIAHGGSLPKKPAPRRSRKKAPAKRKSSASQSVCASAARKPTTTVELLGDGSDSDSSSDKELAPKKRKIGVRVDGGSVADDSDDETTMDD